MKRFPRHKNLDRYVITRIIGDYQKNKNALTELEDAMCYSRSTSNFRIPNPSDPTVLKALKMLCTDSKIRRLKDECDAVETAVEWTRKQDSSEKYIKLIEILYWKKTWSKMLACERLEINQNQCNIFLENFRAIVAAKMGKLEFY